MGVDSFDTDHGSMVMDNESYYTHPGSHNKDTNFKIETRLIDERFASVMGECVIVTLKVIFFFYVLFIYSQRSIS
jgi:hypothetical protein